MLGHEALQELSASQFTSKQVQFTSTWSPTQDTFYPRWVFLSLVKNLSINITAWKPVLLCSLYKSQISRKTANNQLLKCMEFPENEIISIPGDTPVLSIPSSNLFFPHLCCQLILPEDLQRKEGVWFPLKIQIHVLPLPSNVNAAMQFTARSFCQV